MAQGRTATARRRAGAAPESGPGGRVRERRLALGLTQADLGADRFSKEYVSQVELGKTPPSAAALDWFSARLGVARDELEGDAGPAALAATEAALVHAEAAIEAHRYDDALATLETVRGGVERGLHRGLDRVGAAVIDGEADGGENRQRGDCKDNGDVARLRAAKGAQGIAEFRPSRHHDDHRKRLNALTFINAAIKELVYRYAAKRCRWVIFRRPNQPLCALDQWVEWLTRSRLDATNAS